MAYYPRCNVVIDVLLEDFAGGASGDLLTIVTTPRSLEWTADHHRSADTFSMELDYKDLPLDSRLARSIRVMVLCGDTGDSDGKLDPANPDHRAFVGFVDAPETTLDGSSETIRLEGRDYTCLFLDRTWAEGGFSIDERLSVLVDTILQHTPGAEDIPVTYSAGAADALPAVALGKAWFTPQPDDDTWTVLVQLCGLVGLLPVIRGDTLEIRSPNAFGSRSVAFRYGVDVERLSFKRKFQEATTRQIRVVAWNPATRTSSEAVYPTTPIVTRRKVSAQGKVTSETAPEIRYPIEGAYTPAELLGIAQGFYEEAARREVEGVLVTRELRDITGAAVPMLANGDTLGIRLAANLPNIAGLSKGEAVALLTGARWGLPAGIADQLVSAWVKAEGLASTFYVRQVRHRWEIGRGYSAEIAFNNFIVAGGTG